MTVKGMHSQHHGTQSSQTQSCLAQRTHRLWEKVPGHTLDESRKRAGSTTTTTTSRRRRRRTGRRDEKKGGERGARDESRRGSGVESDGDERGTREEDAKVADDEEISACLRARSSRPAFSSLSLSLVRLHLVRARPLDPLSRLHQIRSSLFSSLPFLLLLLLSLDRWACRLCSRERRPRVRSSLDSGALVSPFRARPSAFPSLSLFASPLATRVRRAFLGRGGEDAARCS